MSFFIEDGQKRLLLTCDFLNWNKKYPLILYKVLVKISTNYSRIRASFHWSY